MCWFQVRVTCRAFTAVLAAFSSCWVVLAVLFHFPVKVLEQDLLNMPSSSLSPFKYLHLGLVTVDVALLSHFRHFFSSFFFRNFYFELIPLNSFELIPLNSFGTYSSAWQLKPVSAFRTVPCLFVLFMLRNSLWFAKLNPSVSTLHCGHDVGHFESKHFNAIL